MKGIFKKTILLILCIFASAVCAGCGKNNKPDAQPEADDVITETVTEPVTEAITEAQTELFEYRSVLEVLPEETLSWIESFDENNVDKLVYTIWGEEMEEFVITDKEKIRAFFDAITQLTVAGPVNLFASDAGDTFDFYYAKDYDESSTEGLTESPTEGFTESFIEGSKEDSFVRFAFTMGSLGIGDTCYETDQADLLWELTGEVLGPI